MSVQGINTRWHHFHPVGSVLRLLDRAVEVSDMCRSLIAGKMFEVEFDVLPLFQGLDDDEMVHALDVIGFRRGEYPAGSMTTGICAPAACRPDLVKKLMFPSFLVSLLQLWSAVGRGWWPALAPGDNVTELGDWRDMATDFGIVGVGHCGTTSLRKNLVAHPGIALQHEWETEGTVGEDHLWWYTRKFLPTKELVDQLQALRSRREVAVGHRVVMGMANPGYAENPVIIRMLQHAGAKILASWCDPLHRLATMCNYYGCACGSNITELRRAARAIAAEPLRAKVWEMQRFMVRQREFEASCVEEGIDLAPVAPLLRNLEAEGAPTPIILLREAMNAEAWRTFQAITLELGAVGDFPRDHRFEVHHKSNGSSKRKRMLQKLQPRAKALLKEWLSEDYVLYNELWARPPLWQIVGPSGTAAAPAAQAPSSEAGADRENCRWGFGC